MNFADEVLYAEHALTYVLQDVLGGNSKTMVIVTGVLSPLQYKPTQGALEFGDNCKGVQRVVQVEKKPLSHAEMVRLALRCSTIVASVKWCALLCVVVASVTSTAASTIVDPAVPSATPVDLLSVFCFVWSTGGC